MASSYDTSANSFPQNAFGFSTHPFMTTSFSDLLASGTTDDDNPSSAVNHGKRGGGLSLSDRIAERTGSGVPKFKSLPPPSLPISPPLVSPSSYFAIPPGLSPAELLDSPVLLNASNVSICFYGGFFNSFWSFFWLMGVFFLRTDSAISYNWNISSSSFQLETQFW